MTKLVEHFKSMQAMASRYIEPNGSYIDRNGLKWTNSNQQSEAFINDMIHMLDGPEQREAEAELEEACPGHVASFRDKKVCRNCGLHIDALRPDER